MPTSESDGRRDFDFLLGTWRVHNRRLLRRLEGCTDWEEFETSLSTRPILAGLGNVDSFYREALQDGAAWEGFTLRLFDPETRSWSIWWAATSRPGRLDPPVVGGFTDGRGRSTGTTSTTAVRCASCTNGRTSRLRRRVGSRPSRPTTERPGR
jgi:hypothetical protein